MINATKNEKLIVKEILAGAFKDNSSVNYILKERRQSKHSLYALMDYSFDVCHRFGKIWLSDDRSACVLVLYPHKKRTSLVSIWLDIKLIFTAIGISGIKKAVDREAKIKAKQPKEPLAYLWFIGVDPNHQGSGIGTKLLEEVLADARQQNLPVYLETSTQRNLPWYKKHGFVEYDQLDLGYTLHFLKYSPAK